MEKKNVKLFSAIALVALALLVVGATYAYFQNQYGSASNADVSVTTYTTDMLTFETGDAINISADQATFAQGKGNRTGSTFARATLTANNKTNTATANYYVYLNIENNTFEYSIDESTPELILTVTNSAGTEVTDISGLTHTSVTDGSGATISGYDITNKSGLITLFNNREITASPNKEETWNIKLTFVNYNKDQNGNAGKSMSAKVMIQKEPIVTTLVSYITNLYTGTQGENGIYYHDSSLTNGANDNSYRFAGASESVNNFVCFGSNESPCPEDNLYRIIGVFDRQVKLIKATKATSTLLGTDGAYASDTTYKWSNLGTCPSNTTAYIKNENVTKVSKKNTLAVETGPSDPTGDQSCNEWKYSELNKTNLNTNFITNIGADWAAKIAETTWKVGGNTWSNIGTQPAKTVYQNEIVSPVTTYTTDNVTDYSAKVGLMYVSDYMYAAPQDKWTLVGYNSSDASKDYSAATSVNWMYMGLLEWTISRTADYASNALSVLNTGNVYNLSANNVLALRPVFYLTSFVNYVSGSGTATDPILVN